MANDSSHSWNTLDTNTNTGPSSYKVVSQPAISNVFYPQIQYRTFDFGDPQVILKKLKEFNKKCGDGNNKIDETMLEGIIKLCNQSLCDDNHIAQLFSLLDWPDGKKILVISNRLSCLQLSKILNKINFRYCFSCHGCY